MCPDETWFGKEVNIRKPIAIAITLILISAIITSLSYWGVRAVYSKAKVQSQRLTIIGNDARLAKAAALWVKHSISLSPNRVKVTPPEGPTFVFVGHTYRFNGCGDPSCEIVGPTFEDAIDPMEFFVQSTISLGPSRVIFGGDTLPNLSTKGLKYLLDVLAPGFEGFARFIHGNHDDVGANDDSPNELFRAVFPKPYSYEDVEGVRLVYLRSFVSPSPGGGEVGFDARQLQFLSEALSDTAYDVALVFLHHGLWLADEPIQHTNWNYNRDDRSLTNGFWITRMLPILEQGRVRAVFAGDGGYMQPTIVTQLCGIPHYVSGWDRDLQRRPAEFLQIVWDRQNRVQVLRNVMFDNQLFRMPIKQVQLRANLDKIICSEEEAG